MTYVMAAAVAGLVFFAILGAEQRGISLTMRPSKSVTELIALKDETIASQKRTITAQESSINFIQQINDSLQRTADAQRQSLDILEHR